VQKLYVFIELAKVNTAKVLVLDKIGIIGVLVE
jgi:hypothetical protein